MKYLVRLKPVDPYFFGGELTFGDEKNANYLVKSELYPQQTTLLGMIRKEVLIAKKLLNKNMKYKDSEKEEIEKWIGEKSFDIESEDVQNFGAIKAISPLFVANNDFFYITAPFDKGLTYKKVTGENIHSNLGTPKDFVPVMEKYNPKKGVINKLISSQNSINLEIDKIFKQVGKIGIQKDKEESEEGKFYKQFYYKMADEYEFAFILELNKDIFGDKYENIVFMGGERSAFRMKIEKKELRFKELFEKTVNPSDEKVILLSDAFVDENIYELSDFAITETISFRNFHTTESYSYKHKTASKYTLLKRGSVFYVKNKQQKEELMKKLNSENLQNIGLNIYL